MKTHMTTTLHTLVVKELNPARGIMDKEVIAKWMEDLPDITHSMFRLMGILVFSPVSDKLVNRHLGQIQHECIFMMDVLYHYPEFPEPMVILYEEVLKCLQQILEKLETCYVKHFNKDAVMPVIRYRPAAETIESGIDVMVASMKKHKADLTLQALIVGKMAGLSQAGRGSFHKMVYLENLQKKVIELCSWTNNENTTARLQRLLLSMNFNTPGFIAYYKSKITEELAGLYDVQGQLEYLYDCQKLLMTFSYQHKAVRFEPKLDKIKDVLLAYVNAELYAINRKRNIDTYTPVITPENLNTPASDFRIQVCFSVDALAYFFKLLIKSGVITSGSKSRLLLFVAKSFQTPGIGNSILSPNSLGTKYKQVVQTTAKNVRTALVRMLKILDEEFDLG